jgi:hypothetical protein
MQFDISRRPRRDLTLCRVEIIAREAEANPPLKRIVRAAGQQQQAGAHPLVPDLRAHGARPRLDDRRPRADADFCAGCSRAVGERAIEDAAIDDGRERRRRRRKS